MQRSRLSTQIGVLFFVIISVIVSLISWQHYREAARALPLQFEVAAEHNAEFIAASIANLVLYKKIYPLWSQMRKIQQHFIPDTGTKLVSYGVVDGKQQVLVHSDTKVYPLMSSLNLGEPSLKWVGEKLYVTVAVLSPMNARRLGMMLVVFDGSFIQAELMRHKQNLLVYLLLSLFISATVAWLIRNRISRSFEVLKLYASKIGSGSLKDENLDSHPRELSKLAYAMQSADASIVAKSEEIKQLAKVLEQADELVIMTDTCGVIAYVNPAFERVSGYRKEEVVGKSSSMLKSGEHDSDYYARMWSVLLAGKVWKQNFKNRSKDGESYEVTQTISPLFDEQEKIHGFVAVQRDVTQQLKIQQKMHHTDRVESLGVLAGGIAHDFNNLLTAILGNAALSLIKLDASSPVYDNIKKIEMASYSAADLCRQMLAYSGKGQFVVKSVNLSVLLEEMGKLIEVSIAKNIVMRYQLAESLPLIDADATQMQQIVLNLITNASEAIDGKSGAISLSTGVMHLESDYLYESIGDVTLEEGRYIYLEVSDTGCGMDAVTKKKIFDPFFTTKFTGRGLGMSAMLGIVNGHKGALRVYSELGKGTTIRILFPQSAEQSWLAEPAMMPVNLDVTGSVLIIDDEETIREVATAMLEDIGYQTRTAVDGLDGLECYRKYQHEISFVIMDMTMPRMNGEECFRALRQLNPAVKVMLSSGYNEQEATSRFSGKGLAGFIQKTYTPQDLAQKISEIQ
ncbi:MAG: PAS domain S-box protein [Mariprofundaceae bacterium]